MTSETSKKEELKKLEQLVTPRELSLQLRKQFAKQKLDVVPKTYWNHDSYVDRKTAFNVVTERESLLKIPAWKKDIITSDENVPAYMKHDLEDLLPESIKYNKNNYHLQPQQKGNLYIVSYANSKKELFSCSDLNSGLAYGLAILYLTKNYKKKLNKIKNER